MIIKYGTSEPAAVVDAKNIPSWVNTKPTKEESTTETPAPDNEKKEDEK
jgi:hypothetical protein